MNYFRMLPICSLLFIFMRTTTSLDSIVPGQSILYHETLVSASAVFELGFFRPGTSNSLYVGIWYKDSPSTVVWVANREAPLNNTSGVLQINDQGALVLLSDTESIAWSSNISGKAENPTAQLLDSGNLVVRNGHDNNQGHLLWQSFDYPCDTLLPGMKLGWNLETDLDRFLSSWKSENDPGQGDYILKMDIRGYPQLVFLKGNVIKARARVWNGLNFTGYLPITHPNLIYGAEFVFNEKEVYFKYEPLNRSVVSRYVIPASGIGQMLVWTSQTSSWDVVEINLGDQCVNYALCGAYSICNVSNDAPVCACLKGFVPKHPEEWNMSHWSNGCIHSIPLDCNNNDGFVKYTDLKLPDTSSSWYNKTMDLTECRKFCLHNCSCTAYANFDVRGGGSGCVLWFDDLIDMSQLSQEGHGYYEGQDLYVRVPASELGSNITNETEPENAFGGHENKQRDLLLIVLPISFLTLLILVGLFVYWIRRQRGKGEDLLLFEVGMSMKAKDSEFTEAEKGAKVKKKEVKLPLFSFASVSAATNKFSDANKLGEGGFGPVYKGKLLNGDEVAVKRLSRRSSQGWVELRNEALLIAKLQHNNLVRLLGCCIDRNEKMLIYEFMPNKSLDCFLFDTTKRRMLDWGTRVRIIDGIAQGLLYLHQYSRFRIIHRDLKASNILLDTNMNPKISDFGMARIFRENELQGNTNRIVGTYGYMSPEYVMKGLFSIKSDVFSFGVLLLEIISGKKNTSFYQTKSLSLLGYAWDLWTSNSGVDLMDPALEDISNKHVVPRYVNIGLLCVQESPADRPTMSDVVSMIGNDTAALPCPKPPAFLNVRDNENSRFARNMEENFSVNLITDSLVKAR